MKMKDKKPKMFDDLGNYYDDIVVGLSSEGLVKLYKILNKALDYLVETTPFLDINQINLDKVIQDTEIAYFLKTKIAFIKNPKSPFFIDVDSDEHQYLKNFNKYLTEKYPNLWMEPQIIIGNEGSIHYQAISGQEYSGRLTLGSNGYLLLKKLAEEPTKTFSYQELVKVLNEPRGHADSPEASRRVVDTVGSVRSTFKVKAKGKDDPFISNNGYGIKVKILFN